MAFDAVVRRKANADPIDVVAPFDVRCMGLAFNGSLDTYQRFRELYDDCLANEIVEVTETGNLCRVVMRYRRAVSTFVTIWFDREQGHSPIRIEVCVMSPSSAPLQRGET